MTLQQLKESFKKAGALPVKKWRVASKSNPGTFHEVKLFANGKIICDCLANFYGYECRHIKEIREKSDLLILAQVYKKSKREK